MRNSQYESMTTFGITSDGKSYVIVSKRQADDSAGAENKKTDNKETPEKVSEVSVEDKKGSQKELGDLDDNELASSLNSVNLDGDKNSYAKAAKMKKFDSSKVVYFFKTVERREAVSKFIFDEYMIFLLVTIGTKSD